MKPRHESPGSPELRITTLGRLEIAYGAVPIGGFASTKARALLCYLAVTGQTHQRTTLADMFWGDMLDSDSRSNLRKALHNLRHLLAPHFTITRSTVSFNRTAPYWLDVEELEQGLSSVEAQGEIERWRAATEIYCGEFLAGVEVKQAELFDEWVALKNTQIRDRVIHALRTLIDHDTEQGAYASALTHTTRLLNLDPWNDQAHYSMLLLLGRSGQRHKALAHYTAYRRGLWETLGLEPEPITTVLYERIATAHSRPVPPLPAQATAFVGREAELVVLKQRLTDPDCRLLTLIGPGGTGKTRLALRVTEQLQSTFPDGVIFIELATIDSHDALISSLATILEVSLYGGGDALVQIHNALRHRECLLVMDNFEQLGEESLILSDLLLHAPAVRILVTSRDRLSMREEWLFDVSGLDYPAEASVTALEGYGAIQLFIQCARRLQHFFVPAPEDLQAILAICRLVEGMPLAIELAAAWIRIFSCLEIAQQIERSLGFLTSSLRNTPARHRSILAVFDQAWRLLTPESRNACMRLAVFRGGFTSPAAQHVGGATPQMLETLTDRSLLRRTEAGRFVFHELLRQYMTQQLQADPATEAAVLDLHCDYIARTLLPIGLELKQHHQQELLLQINAEIENARAAWSRAIATRNISAIGMLFSGLLHFYEIRGWFQEADEVFERALEAVRDPTVENPARHFISGILLLGQGGFCMRYGYYERAERLLTTSISQLTPLQAWREIAYARYGLGQSARDQGEYAQAQLLLDTCLTTFREIKDEFGMRLTLIMLGDVQTKLGQIDQGQQYLQEGLALARRYADIWSISIALHALAELSQQQGHLDHAERIYSEQMTICEELDDPWGQARALHRLGEIALERQDYAGADNLLTRSRDLRQQIDDRLGGISSLNGLGMLAAATGDPNRAQGLFQMAFELAIEAQVAPQALAALAGMTVVAFYQHDLATARTLMSFISQQPALAQETRARIVRLAGQLEASDT